MEGNMIICLAHDFELFIQVLMEKNIIFFQNFLKKYIYI